MKIDGLKKVVSNMDFYSAKLYNLLYRCGVSIMGRIIYPISIIRNRKTYVKAESYFPELERKSSSRIL